jgi:hypothetical protein
MVLRDQRDYQSPRLGLPLPLFAMNYYDVSLIPIKVLIVATAAIIA